MVTCPACGKENEDSAYECKRCRAFLKEDPEHPHHEEHHEQAHAASAHAESVGVECRRCGAFNEAGVSTCTNCGLKLFEDPQAPAAPAGEAPAAEAEDHGGTQVLDPVEASLDKTPPQAFQIPAEQPLPDITPADGVPSLSDELSALAISDQEAAEAGLSTAGNGAHEEPPMDKTPPQAFAPEHIETEPEIARPVTSSRRVAPPPPEPPMPVVTASRKVAQPQSFEASMPSTTSSRKIAPPPPEPVKPPEPPPAAPAPSEKTCASCGAANPPAAKFCFDCGTPFAKKPAPVAQPDTIVAAPMPKIEPAKPAPPKDEAPPSIHVEPDVLHASTSEVPPVEEQIEDAPPALEEEAPPEEHEQLKATSEGDPLPMSYVSDQDTTAPDPFKSEAPPEEEVQPAEEIAEAIPDDAPPAVSEESAPFAASLVLERTGDSFLLAHMDNRVGGEGAQIALGEDPYVAPHAATVTFLDDHLIVKDEGSANGIYVKVRESTPIEPGDSFIAGERLIRFDGPVDLPRDAESDTPFLGAPRPQGTTVLRFSEVLGGGKTGRTCHRSGPVIAIGRSGCDMNFPGDTLLAARHAEVRLGDDGGATLVDLGSGPSGVLIRVKALRDLHAGDVLQIGEQQLRLEIGDQA